MSYAEQTELQLETAARRNPHLSAMITITADAARHAAQDADRAAAEGRNLGLLHGMTIAVKDNIDTAGVATTAGAAFLRDRVPNADAPVVERLRRAGAVIVGKTNMAEVAFGSRSYSAVGGQCRNAWNSAHSPGGSSGGSAVAVAAGMCKGALGTDTGGSVRLPASFNGVSGLRPTVGRVPNRGVLPVSASNDTVGPIAHRAEDAALIFAVIAGYDDTDPYSEDVVLPNFLPALRDGIVGRRIGIPRSHYFDGAAADVGACVLAASKVLEAAGATLVDVDLPMASEAHAHATNLIFSDVCAVFWDRLHDAPESFTPSVFERMRNGLDVSGVQYAEAMAFRMQWKRAVRRAFTTIDLLLSPTAPTAAPLIEDGASLLAATKAVTQNTYAGAYAGIPGLSLPCGFTGEGMPIGLQLEANWWNEPVLFQAGVAYQGRTDFHLRRPADHDGP